MFPLTVFEAKVFEPKNYEYSVHITSDIGSDEWSKFSISSLPGMVTAVFRSGRFNRNQDGMYAEQVAFILVISLAVLVYSMINIVSLVLLKVDDAKRRIAVYTALGATRGDIFLQNLFEMLLLSIGGIILVIASMPLVSFAFNHLSLGIKADWQVILRLAAFSIAVSVFLSLGLVSVILRKSIAETFREAIVK